MTFFFEIPLQVSLVFSYLDSAPSQAALRMALGARGGAEGFAAAALGRIVSHGVLPDTKEEGAEGRRGFSRYVPIPHVHDEASQRLTKFERFVVVLQRNSTWTPPRYRVYIHQREGYRPLFADDVISALSGVSRVDDLTLLLPAFSVSAIELLGNSMLLECKRHTVRTLTVSHAVPPRNDVTVELEDGFPEKSLATLTNFDLSGLTGITRLGSNFVSGSKQLTRVALPPLNGLRELRPQFLADCDRLTVLEWSGLTNVTSIGYCFLYKCEALERLDLSSLTAVTSIDDDFCFGCRSLRRLDMSSFTSLTDIGEDFLMCCRDLETLTLPSSTLKVNEIKDNFLCDCWSLDSLDLTPFSAVTRIGDDCFSNCMSLTNVDLTLLKAVKAVGDGFAEGGRPLEYASVLAALPREVDAAISDDDQAPDEVDD